MEPPEPHVTDPAAAAPPARSLRALRRLASRCTGCPLYRDATQTVFGDGPPHARLVLLGEQPGDREDLEGAPFVGPAGALLDRALVAAGLRRDDVYVSNVVKHFKWERSGKVRLHKKPSRAEVAACRPWWEAEVTLVRPETVVCLGATAAQAVLGPSVRVTKDRGVPLGPVLGASVVVTVHPSAVLRAGPDRAAMLDGLVEDLRAAAALGGAR